MKRWACLIVLCLPAWLLTACQYNPTTPNGASTAAIPPLVISLPAPAIQSSVSLEETLNQRRSVREFRQEALSLAETGQILWAAQGQTADWGGRTAPSAGGLYALDLYLIAGNVQGLEAGLYQYNPAKHQLTNVKDGDRRAELSAASLGQACVREAAIDLVIAAVYDRVTGKYGERGVRYAHLEAGHAAQNACLEVTALGLGAVTVGAFDDGQVRQVCGLAEKQEPLYVIPVGRLE